MHEISPQTVQAAQKHALQSLEHGKSVEEVGKRLQSDDQTKPEIGQSIEASGKTIQKQAQESLEKAQQLKEDPSVEVFSESAQAHINASQNHIEAVKEFQKQVRTHLDDHDRSKSKHE
ncbi:hypothetical protein [Brasilonema bromeliae]|uniref:Uncharacterized protein n=1 Tax=Brasilonema bromeliae SPC951 TaxID=385972 RepID=A0ABX1PEP9_9CYAN|nr:hypothetical protein [Brasilonema bromeliae]NMG22979.1 hypothetical protein [Brasilonema bromeliae SPC951]